MRYLIALLGLVVLTPSDAAERVFAPVAEGAQEVKYLDGTPHVIARGAQGGVILSFEPDNKKRGWVTVFVANTGNTPINLAETDVRAADGDDGQPLHVYSYAELQKQQARSEMWASIGEGLSAASRNIAASNAGNSYQSGSYSSRTQAQAWGSAGYATGSATTNGTYFGSGYNGAAAFQAQQQANAQNAASAERMREANALDRSTLAARAPKANTVEQGANLVGQVKVDLPKAKRGQAASFDVLVPVGAESFIVHFVEQAQ